MSRKRYSPTEALRVLTGGARTAPTARRAVESLHGGYLAEELVIPAIPGARSRRRATVDGYALPRGFAGGSCRFRSVWIEREPLAPVSGDTVSLGGDTDERLPLLERLEQGDPVPDDCDRVLPVDGAIVTGNGRIVVDPDGIPPAGDGLEEAAGPASPLVLERGVALTPRLLAVLLERGVREVSTWLPFEVGLATVGGELVDPVALESSPHVAGPLAADLNGFWLPPAVTALGQIPRPAGSIPREPPAILAVLTRFQRQGITKAILTGGLGDGVRDRTLEALQAGPFRILLSSARVQPGGRVVFARGLGMDLLVLGGSPLEAAAAFDLFVAPSLIGAHGAPAELWDWSLNRLPCELCPGDTPRVRGCEWSATPSLDAPTTRLLGVIAGNTHARGAIDGAGSRPVSSFEPLSPGQTGWWLRPPPGYRDATAYWVPARA